MTRPLSLHSHISRDIKALGKCPACDRYWKLHHPVAVELAAEDAAYAADKAAAEVAGLLAAANAGVQ